LINHPVAKGLNLAIKEGMTNSIKLNLLNTPMTVLGNEGYSLSVKPDQIQINANKPAGLFYGIQSLMQLVPNDDGSKVINIPSAEVTDYPRFGWRGLMLDVSRHFFTINEVKQFIDAMAFYKFNTFHMHLTDDNGWRIEIKSLPKLTSIGAWRAERFGTWGDRAAVKEGEPTPYGGFYTQEQIKDLVRYAASKQITILPR
jgi:hexosaminidase